MPKILASGILFLKLIRLVSECQRRYIVHITVFSVFSSSSFATFCLVFLSVFLSLACFFQVHDNGNQISLSPAINTWWQKHTARITALSWSPNGRCLATGSLDTAVIVWSLDKPKDAVVLRSECCFERTVAEAHPNFNFSNQPV